MRTPLLILLACALAVAGIATASGDDRPNVVWIFVEDMNGWYGCYGDDTVPTPNLDALAESGVRFDRAYMPAGVCSATRSAIALGAMQTSLGVHNHRSSRERVPGETIQLPEGVQTVYELMREAGYYVCSSRGKNDFNFLFDLDELYDALPSRMGPHAGWRDRPEGTPFFAQIQLRGGKNSGQFDGAPPREKGDDTPHTDPEEMEVAPYYPDHPVMRREYAHHYDTIRQTDDEVGEIMASLKEDGLLEDTVVFFWTDHGMRLPRHKQWLYEGGVRVPLLVAGPGLEAGASRDDLVSGIDITATTLALAGVEKPDWVEGRDFFAADHEPREFVVSARDRCDYTIDRVRAVTTGRFKYLRNFKTDRPFMQPQYRDGRDYVEVPRRLHEAGELNEVQDFMWSEERVPEEFYDLENDPHETVNLADDPAFTEQLERHRALLEDWIERTDDQGQYPESIDGLLGVLARWDTEAVNPEYREARIYNARHPSPPKGFETIHDGRSLDAWAGDADHWSVENGFLVGRNDGEQKESRFLVWKGGELRNFELRLEVKITADGNSGIQYRSHKRPDLGEEVVSGYQFDVAPGRSDYDGMLYEEKGRRILARAGQKVVVDPEGQPWVVGELSVPEFDPETWRDCRLVVRGNHYRHWIDGHQTVDVVDLDEKGRAIDGLLALQVHGGDEMTVQYRNLYLKRFGPRIPLVTAEEAPIPDDSEMVEPQGGWEKARGGGASGRGAPE